MKELYKNYLFSKHILVNDTAIEGPETAFAALTMLGRKFGIRIIRDPKYAVCSMIKDAERNLGEWVPEPFYRGFPDSVREMTSDQLLYDQLMHYTMTYGFGWFEDPGHSIFEEQEDPVVRDEKRNRDGFENLIGDHILPKNFVIMCEDEATEFLTASLNNLLASNRPLSMSQIELVTSGYRDFGDQIIPEKMPCKDTVVRLLYQTKDLRLCSHLVLSDTIKLLNYIQYMQYGSENLKKLNLKNQDRKFITQVINWFFEDPDAVDKWRHYTDVYECHEKRKNWCGLLHHIHYHPHTKPAQIFVNGIRDGKNQSNLAIVERHMQKNDPVSAARHMKTAKGAGALIRNLNYFVSRCDNNWQINDILRELEEASLNPVLLIQLMMQHHNDPMKGCPRKFIFTRNNRIHVHNETPEETEKRRTCLPAFKRAFVEDELHQLLESNLHGRLGKVWVDPQMSKIAVPLQMSTGQSGFGILPTGSRVDIPEGKFVRAFTYWEKVNDIDLSCFALDEQGNQREFSWRNMWHQQGADITFSGDQTSGYNGGSEYFDINIELFKANNPEFRCIVFCNNVYSGINFDQCECKAGFMIREESEDDIPRWKGEREPSRRTNYRIFDPKTVETSFRINAESMFAYLFAIDLKTRQMVWLNMARADNTKVAGTSRMDFLLRYLTVTDVYNMRMLYEDAATDLVNHPEKAEVIVSDRNDSIYPESAKVIHSWDFEEALKLLSTSNPS